MKKILMGAIALIGFSAASHAQSTAFKPFKVDLALGYAIPSGKGAGGGVAFSLEPKYAINDNITAGLRMEGAVTVRGSVYANGQEFKGDAAASSSYLLTGDYYFNTNTFRPFAGLGIGVYRLAAVSFDTGTNSSGEIAADTKFGGAPRVGFEVGHFRMAAEYNVMGKSGSLNNNYLNIKLGFFIGGGRLN